MWNFTNLQSLDLNRNFVFETPFETESLKETCVYKNCVKKAPDPQTGLHRNLNHNDNEKVVIWLFFSFNSKVREVWFIFIDIDRRFNDEEYISGYTLRAFWNS